MTGKHHLIAGIGAGICMTSSLIYFKDTTTVPAVFTGVGLVVGSLFPDIDSSTSKLGKRVKPVSKIISKLFGHRGFFHSLIFIGLLFLLLKHIFDTKNISQYNVIYIGFCCGCLLHLVCDMMTKGGVPLLYPFSKFKFHLTGMKSGSKYEPIALGFVILCIVAVTILCITNHISISSFYKMNL